MSNLREAYAATDMAGLGWSGFVERPIDRVAAAGFASELGVMLWSAKYQDSASAVVKAAHELVEIFGSRYLSESREMCERVVRQCLTEYLKPSCMVCEGRGEMELNNGVKVVCGECRGAKVKRYSDSERARAMQISLAKVRAIGHKIAWLAGEINRLDSGVNFVMNRQLERQVAAS